MLELYVALAKQGTKKSVRAIMEKLNRNMTIAESKFIDYALGLVDTEEGINEMERFLFHGTQIQRNYCALYFGRKDEYLLIRKAYDLGLIDEKQAFSR